MNSEYEFKVARGKASYGGNNQVRNLAEVLKMNKEATQAREIRVLHCANLETTEVSPFLLRESRSANNSSP